MGRTGHLAMDLTAILHDAGEPTPASFPPANVTRYAEGSGVIPEVDGAIVSAEREVIARFYAPPCPAL